MHPNPLMPEFCQEILCNNIFIGDVLEFGTGSGTSTERMNLLLNGHKKIITFDGFKGFPKTKKIMPREVNWNEGVALFDEKATRNKLGHYKNITVFTTMMSDLKNPENYNIKNISGVNIDVDLYESTVDCLNFVDKCEWKDLILRFDDWGPTTPTQIAQEIYEHEYSAFYDYIKLKNYKYEFYKSENDICSLVKISR